MQTDNKFDQRVIPASLVESDEGKYFVAANPTPGTGIAQSIQTSFLDTNALATIFNGGSAGKSIYIDYVRLICTVAGASATSCELVIAEDFSNRYSSGGSALTPVPANSDSQAATNATVNFGAVTATAAGGSRRIIGRLKLKQAILVVGDEIFIKFGASAPSGSGPLNAGPAVYAHDAAPVVVGGGHTLLLHVFNPANAVTPPSWEVEIGYFER